MDRLARGLLAALLLGSPAAALPCSVCGCGDPQLEASDPAATSGRLRLQLESEYLAITAGSEGAPGSIDHLEQYSLRTDVVYAPLPDLSLLAQLPVVHKDLATTGPADRPSSHLTGLGDAEVGARWVLLTRIDLGRQQRQDLAVDGGVSLPTGGNSARDASGARIDEHGQLGTGSFGPYLGLHYAFSRGDWYAFGSVSARVHTTNGYGYQYGQALLWSAHAQRMLSARLAVSLGVDGREAWVDLDHGRAVDSTGGLVLAATPAAYLDVGQGFWLGARAQIPFFTSLIGQQTVGPVVTAGVQYQFL